MVAINKQDARDALNHFSVKWGNKYGYAIISWENNWEALTFTSIFHWRSVRLFIPPM